MVIGAYVITRVYTNVMLITLNIPNKFSSVLLILKIFNFVKKLSA